MAATMNTLVGGAIPTENTYELPQDLDLNSAQINQPTTRAGIVLWAIRNQLGPWVVLPHFVAYEMVLNVSRESLVDGKRVICTVKDTQEKRYLVLQRDLVYLLAARHSLFDTPTDLLSSITCSVQGCMAPVVFQFDAEVVYNVLQRFQIEGAASVICRNILTGTRKLSEIDGSLRSLIRYASDAGSSLTAAVTEILRRSVV